MSDDKVKPGQVWRDTRSGAEWEIQSRPDPKGRWWPLKNGATGQVKKTIPEWLLLDSYELVRDAGSAS